jgi:hypothetical protein
MLAFKSVGGVFHILPVALLGASVVPSCLLAGDRDSNGTPAKAAPAKTSSPGPLTERERWMLDRMEELEKCFAALEAKGHPTAANAAEAAVVVSALAGAAGIAPVVANTVSSAAALASMAWQEQAPPAKHEKAEPFAFADFTWLTGIARTKELAMDTKFFTPEIRSDVDYIYDFNHPKDNTIGGSSEIFRANEVQVTQLGVGGDFHYDNVRARLMTQFGLYSETTPRNDASPSRGQCNLADAYR